MSSNRRHTVVLIVVLVVTALALEWRQHASDVRLRDAQVASCERGNQLRRESNQRLDAHTAEKNAMLLIAETARRARLASGTPNDLRAAKKYAEAARELRRVRFSRVPIIDCRRTIPKAPWW